MSLRRHKQDWEDLAQLDLLWAIAADPSRQHGGWDQHDFFENGQEGGRRRGGLFGPGEQTTDIIDHVLFQKPVDPNAKIETGQPAPATAADPQQSEPQADQPKQEEPPAATQP